MAHWYEPELFRGHVREPDVDDLRYIARDMGLEDVVVAKGAEVVGRFNCRGRFLFLLWNHPTGKDLENARRFAREVTSG